MIRASSGQLRQNLSQRNIDRSADYEHEMTYGEVPSIIYREENGTHGNFLPAAYRSICAHPEWQKRLRKAYTAGKRVSRSWERQRYEPATLQHFLREKYGIEPTAAMVSLEGA